MLLVSLYGRMSGCLAIFHVGFGGHLAGCLGGHIAISHVYFGGHLDRYHVPKFPSLKCNL